MSRNLYKIFSLSLVSLFVFAACGSDDDPGMVEKKPMPKPGEGQQVMDPNAQMNPPNTDSNDNSELLLTESLWEVKDEVLVEHASNPMPVYWDDEILILAYEYRAKQLLEGPSDKSRFVSTEDGEVFVAVEEDLYDHRPPAIEFEDGTQRRFIYMPAEGGVGSLASTDGGETFAPEKGLRYEVESEGEVDPKYFGVSTFFMDSEGGVVLLYNVTNEEGDIVVNRAYSPPNSDGMKFELTDENILGGSLDKDHFADPHTVIRSNGEIWLIVMHQSVGAAPPKGKQGFIYAYMSEDDGESFNLVGKLFDYDDFEFDTVYSLNDPKIIEFPEGQLRVVVAAMIEDEESESGYGWVLVSAKE